MAERLQTTLEKWRQIEQAATQGPWKAEFDPPEVTLVGNRKQHWQALGQLPGFGTAQHVADCFNFPDSAANAAFIVHARNTYAPLLTRLTEMAAASTKLLNDLEVFRKSHERLQEGTIVLQAWDVSGSKKAVEAALRPLEAVDG